MRSQNIHFEGLKLDDVAHISEKINSKMKKSEVKSNDVLLNITGASIGRVSIVPKNFPKANINQHISLIRTNDELLPSFLKNFIESEIGQKAIFRDQAGQTREALNMSQIKSFRLGVPSNEEQEKIVSFYNLFNKKIQKQYEKVELLKEQKKGYMQKIFNRELRFKDEYGKTFPESREYNFAEFLEIPLKEKEENPIKENLLSVKLHLKGIAVSENIATLKIGSTTYYKRKAGQFIYGKQNLFNGAFGIIPQELDGFLSSGDIPTLDFKKEFIEPLYFYYYLSQWNVYKRMENVSTGTGSKRIHEGELLKQKMRLPCLGEQKKIVKFLRTLESKIFLEEEKLKQTEKQKQGFMQQMFI